MSIALALNDLVACDRNRGLDSNNKLPLGHTVSAEQCLKMIPGLDREQVTGGAIWFDAMALNTERLNLSFVKSAAELDATVCNYVRACDYIFAKGSVVGAKVEDVLTGENFDIRATLVVNASGPWANDFSDSVPGLRKKTPQSWVLATNIVIRRRLFDNYAVGLSARNYTDSGVMTDKRARDLFFVPWRSGTMVGTFYRRFTGSADDCCAEASDIHDMLRQINVAYPRASLSPADVSFVHAGLLPEPPRIINAAGDIQLMKQAVLVDAAKSSHISGLLSLVGIKYTTAPQVAERVVRSAMEILGRRWVTSLSDNTGRSHRSVDAETTLGENDVPDTESPDAAARLRKTYGYEVSAVLRYCSTPEGRQLIGSDEPIFAGQVTYSVKDEMAQCLADVVYRRTGLGTFGYPGRHALERCAELMARELAWTNSKTSAEVETVEQAYSALAEAGCMELPKHSHAASLNFGANVTAPTGEH